MIIKDFYPGWIADNICCLCENDEEFCCDLCKVFELIISDEVKKIESDGIVK